MRTSHWIKLMAESTEVGPAVDVKIYNRKSNRLATRRPTSNNAVFRVVAMTACVYYPRTAFF
jgi:hypothetical protein